MRARVVVAGAAVVLVAAGSVAAVGFLRDDTEARSEDTTATAATVVPVELRTLKDAERLSGELGYADEQTIAAGPAEGVLTDLPEEGSTVHRGEAVYDVDDEPVVLLIGRLPLYRDLTYGVDDGADVRQLERNLERLGYDPGTVNKEFTAYTQDAVEDLQEDLGVEETGEVTAAQFLVLPDEIRVGAPQATLGTQLTAAAATTLYDATSTARAVTIDLDTSDEALAEIGSKATVTLPDGSTVKATVDGVGTVATPTDTESEDPSAEATIPVTLTLDDPKKVAGLSAAPVTVDLTRDTRKQVEAVPVTALVALAEGGFGIRRESGELVAVETGLFAAGYVEITAGLEVGDRIEVPE
ncbi:MAG: peptidoglycan-binding protein [Actinomycetota bacterium]|nr:peptidoglycan-binding protein [Actinomycetota bacterium]